MLLSQYAVAKPFNTTVGVEFTVTICVEESEHMPLTYTYFIELLPIVAVAGLKVDPLIPEPEKVPPVGVPTKVTVAASLQYCEAKPVKETAAG